MATIVQSQHAIGVSETTRRVWAIVGGSSGNLVEWYDFYVYSFTALYFASEFFPAGDQTTQLLNAAGVFAADLCQHRRGGACAAFARAAAARTFGWRRVRHERDVHERSRGPPPSRL